MKKKISNLLKNYIKNLVIINLLTAKNIYSSNLYMTSELNGLKMPKRLLTQDNCANYISRIKYL